VVGVSPAGVSPAGVSPAGDSPAGDSPAGDSPVAHKHRPQRRSWTMKLALQNATTRQHARATHWMHPVVVMVRGVLDGELFHTSLPPNILTAHVHTSQFSDGDSCPAYHLRSGDDAQAQCETSDDLNRELKCVYTSPGQPGGRCLDAASLLPHPEKGSWDDSGVWIPDAGIGVPTVKRQRCTNCRDWCTKCPAQFGASNCDNVEVCMERCDTTVCMLDLAICEACHAAPSLPQVGVDAAEAVRNASPIMGSACVH
jgi:hypothetical protein